MNIRDVVAACKLTKPTLKFSDDVEPLLLAMAAADLPQVALNIKNNPRSFLRHQRVVNAFFENFTPELGALFLKQLSFSIIEKSVDMGRNIPRSFWEWLPQQKHKELLNDLSQWSCYTLVSKNKSAFEQECAHQFRHAYIQKSSEAKTSIVNIAIPHLNAGCVLRWTPDDWGVLKPITTQQFLTHFSNISDPDRMMAIDDPNDLLALQTSFDNLPNFEMAFNAFFAPHKSDYEYVCLQLASPEGFKKSTAFRSLDKATQKNFLNSLKADFEADAFDEFGVSIGHYKHILDYTSEELFLKRFNEPNETLMKKMHIGSNQTMQNLFAKKLSLSSLHALVTHSPHILLKMNKNMAESISQCFSDGWVLMGFFNNIDGKTFEKILHRLPNLVHWRDEKGNSLGHWAAVFNAIEGDWFNAVVNNPSLLEYNHIGQSIRDIMQQDIDRDLLSNTDEVAQLDKVILTREIGNLNTRTSVKRKI